MDGKTIEEMLRSGMTAEQLRNKLDTEIMNAEKRMSAEAAAKESKELDSVRDELVATAIKYAKALGYDKDINKEDMNVLLNELKHIEETFIPLMKVMTKVEDAMKCECKEEPNVKNTITTDFKMNEADMDKIINTFLKGII